MPIVMDRDERDRADDDDEDMQTAEREQERKRGSEVRLSLRLIFANVWPSAAA